MSACSDEEDFSTSSSCLLTISNDTVSFDTVLTTIGSSTKRVVVYNNNDNGVRAKSVRLTSGGTSGFRINVDGISGPYAENIEILGNDSIFMFVDINAPTQNSNVPKEITDTILFSLESGVQQYIILSAYGQDVNILQGKVYKNGENAVMDSNTPYLILDSLKVEEGATLTINAGTTLYLHSKSYIIVEGKLIVNGNETQPVTFKGDRTDKMFPYLPYDRIDGQWGGLRFTESSTENQISYADIHGGDNAITCEESGVDKCKLTILNSVIHNFNGYGLTSTNNKLVLKDTQISNAKYDCIRLIGGDYDFDQCTIAQFSALHSERGYAFYCWNYYLSEDGDTVSCPLNVNIKNTILTGYGKDELAVCMPYTKADLVLSISRSLLNSDTTGMRRYISMNIDNCLFESEDNAAYKAKNFKTIDTHNYIYDFHLDSLSLAFGKNGERNLGAW